jgi:hypothetical protein
MKPAADIVRLASPRPWTYHNNGQKDWIEDAVGNDVVLAVGHIDGPLIVACVNEAHYCGLDEGFIEEGRIRDGAVEAA